MNPANTCPPAWAVHGTSGYDFVYFGNSIFIQSENEEKFNEIFARAIGHHSSYWTDPAEIVYRSKTAGHAKLAGE